jgi:peptidoglycan/xylan/chitin deacetylase (PgdA/CDA1 family)
MTRLAAFCCALALLAAAAALLLAGCGQPETASPPTPTAVAAVAASPSPTLAPAPSPSATGTARPSATLLPSPTASPASPGQTSLPPSATPARQPSPVPTLPAVASGLITHGDRSQGQVALTFDACQTVSSPAGYDADIVRILTETHTSATLFLGGLWMQSHPTQTQLLASIPYLELGNHSWSHPDFAKISEAEMVSEITRTQRVMHQLAGRQAALFRLPFGTYTPQALQAIAGQGLRTIQWDVVTGDPDPNIKADAIVRTVLTKAQNGSIVIMHVNGRGWHTAEALPDLIAGLRRRGFKLVTVSELLRGVPPPATLPSSNAVVTGTLLNVRAEPSATAPLVDTLQAGERIAVLCTKAGELVPEWSTDVWYRIAWQPRPAYVLSALVALDAPVEPCPAAEP